MLITKDFNRPVFQDGANETVWPLHNACANGVKTFTHPKMGYHTFTSLLAQRNANGLSSKKHCMQHAHDQQHHFQVQQASTFACSNLTKLHWSPSLPFQHVQTLLPLFTESCFTFPSWYLFAIGLKHIFSFRWKLPPASCTSPKEHDS